MDKSVIFRLVAVLCVLFFITALVLGAVALSYGGGGGDFSVDLKRENISYSSETRLRYSILMAPLFGTGNTLPPFDELDKFVDNLFLSFSRAGVGEEKLNLILDRVEDMGLADSTESPILGFLESTYNAITAGGEEPIDSIVSAEQVEAAIAQSYEFLIAANMTVDDVGRVLYEMALCYADERRAELLLTLGKENFTMVTVGTYSVYKTATNLNGEFPTLSEARTVGQALVSLGLFQRRALDKIGADGVDELLFFDYRIPEDGATVDSEFAAKYNEVMARLGGGLGSVLNLSSQVLGGLSPLLFEELYFANLTADAGDNQTSRAHEVWAMFDFAKTFANALETATETDVHFANETQAVDYFAGLYADYKVLNDVIYNTENPPSRESYLSYAKEKTEEITGAVNLLRTASEDFASFDELKSYSGDNPDGFAALYEKAKFLTGYEINLEAALIDVLSTLTKGAIVRIFTPHII